MGARTGHDQVARVGRKAEWLRLETVEGVVMKANEPTGPRIDRTLMRIKDLIIIGTAIFAIVRWFYSQKQGLSHRLDMLENRVTNIERYNYLPSRRDR